MNSVFDAPPFDVEDVVARARNSALLDLWMNLEAPCARVSRESWIRQFREIGYTSDGWPAKPRTDSLRLLRGARIEDQRGMAWTTSYYLADYFARRNEGDVWVCDVPSTKILARIGPNFGDQVVPNAPEFICDVENLKIRLF